MGEFVKNFYKEFEKLANRKPHLFFFSELIESAHVKINFS